MRIADGFTKWLSSTRFQVAILAIGLIYVSMEIFEADPTVAIKAIRDVSLGYFTARVVQPLLELAKIRFSKPKNSEDQA